MYIYEDYETGEVVIENVRFKGFIERERTCDTCENITIYSEYHQRYFCAHCNDWKRLIKEIEAANKLYEQSIILT